MRLENKRGVAVPTLVYSCDNCETKFEVNDMVEIEQLVFKTTAGFEMKLDYCPGCKSVVLDLARYEAKENVHRRLGQLGEDFKARKIRWFSSAKGEQSLEIQPTEIPQALAHSLRSATPSPTELRRRASDA